MIARTIGYQCIEDFTPIDRKQNRETKQDRDYRSCAFLNGSWSEMSDLEKRKNQRYGLELSIAVTWKDKSGHTRETTGMTENISPAGAFIVCESPIEQGCPIDLRFDLPIALGGSPKSRISASGTVVRNVPRAEQGTGHGYGVRFAHFRFNRVDGL